MIKVDNELIEQVLKESRISPRLRKNYNFHKENEVLQRMLNVLQPGTYTQPHKHIAPLKHEAFVIIKGKVAVVEYSDLGEIAEVCLLEPGNGNFIAEITPGSWHNIFAMEPDSVVYEVKDGPYIAETDKTWAPWAPSEGTEEAKNFFESTLLKVVHFLKQY
jgi:cupin fold WbuC family metalloprotein